MVVMLTIIGYANILGWESIYKHSFLTIDGTRKKDMGWSPKDELDEWKGIMFIGDSHTSVSD